MSKVSKEDLKKLQELAGIYTDTLNEKDAGHTDNEKLAVGHVDNERDMIRRQLYQMGKYTVELAQMLKELPDSDFPNWWQAKITKAGYDVNFNLWSQEVQKERSQFGDKPFKDYNEMHQEFQSIMKQRGINVFRQKQLSMAKQRAERQAQIDRYTKKPEQAEMDF